MSIERAGYGVVYSEMRFVRRFLLLPGALLLVPQSVAAQPAPRAPAANGGHEHAHAHAHEQDHDHGAAPPHGHGAARPATPATPAKATKVAPMHEEAPADEAPAPGHTHPIEVEVRQERAGTEAASRLRLGRWELALRPRKGAAALLEAAPGVVVAQHAGGGKAAQIFLRGFDADHGTDVALFVDGVPVNMPSHGHGQGYADLSFVIPELVAGMEVYKGPNYARFGDFATAGALELRTAEVLPESFASYTLGQFGVHRGLVASSPALGDDWRAVVAAEYKQQDGPFDQPEALRRLNLFSKVTRDLGGGSALTLSVGSLSAAWRGSGQIPARAVCGEGEAGSPAPESLGQACLDRFGSVDDGEGGATQRQHAQLGYRVAAHDADLHADLYAIRYRFNLFSNFTFFDRDPLRGDGIEQKDSRTVLGLHTRARKHVHLGPVTIVGTLGLELRRDDIETGLYDQVRRERLGARVDADIAETSSAGYAEIDTRLLPQLRFLTGVRLQRLEVAVDDNIEDTSTLGTRGSGSAGSSMVLPKLGAVVTPVSDFHLFAHYGRGFHSNDARGAVLDQGRVQLLTPALGYEVGAKVEPAKNVAFNVAAFLLDLDSEQVWIGDEGTTEASGATRRYGIEVGARGRLFDFLYADADFTVSRAEVRFGPDRGSPVALAPVRTFSAGVAARHKFGSTTPFGSVRFKSISDRAANEAESLVAEGYSLVDAEAGVRQGPIEAALSVENLFGSTWREVSFATTSRLSYEPAAVEGIHYTPGWPRTVMGRVAVYWE